MQVFVVTYFCFAYFTRQGSCAKFAGGTYTGYGYSGSFIRQLEIENYGEINGGGLRQRGDYYIFLVKCARN